MVTGYGNDYFSFFSEDLLQTNITPLELKPLENKNKYKVGVMKSFL